jgi:hypothetical protein
MSNRHLIDALRALTTTAEAPTLTAINIGAQIEGSAADLAARINAGLFGAISPEVRTDLRRLTCTMLGWAEILRAHTGDTAAARHMARARKLFGGNQA